MAGVSFSMVRPQRLLDDDKEQLVEESPSADVHRLKQQQMATDTKVTKLLEKFDRPSMKCALQMALLLVIALAVISIAVKLWNLPSNPPSVASSTRRDEYLDLQRKILDVLTREDYRTPQAACPSKLYTHVGPPGHWDTCYYVGLQDGVMSMEEAIGFCSKMKGKLLSLENQKEENYTKGIILSSSVSQTLVADAAFILSLPAPSVWIGATNAVHDDDADWVWAYDGRMVNYSNWDKGEPRREAGLHCAELNDGSGKWRTVRCDARRPVVCEAPSKNAAWRPMPEYDMTPPEKFCPSNATSCYLFVSFPMRWRRAQDYCVKHGGYLARPDTFEENDKLKRYIVTHTHPRHQKEQRVKWLGASGLRHQMKWISNGQLVSATYQDWRVDSMSLSTEDLCLAYNISTITEPHHWTVAPCYRWLSFVCEIPSPDADEPVEESVVSEPQCISILDERAECSFDLSGSDYRGTQATTRSGHPCLQWSLVPEKRLNAERVVKATLATKASSLEANYCRNPNNETKPWCFFGNPERARWDFCHIPLCQAKDFVRPDSLCGPSRPVFGLKSTCDPRTDSPCCSPVGYCGGDISHCKCLGCTDYRPEWERTPGPDYKKNPNGNFYAVKRGLETWQDAREICRKEGGDLASASILRLGELDDLRRDVHRSIGLQKFWVGLNRTRNDENEETEWRWVNGQLANESEWDSHHSEWNESSTMYNCGVVTRDLKLRSQACFFDLRFICEVKGQTKEKPTATQPPPANLTLSVINATSCLYFVRSQQTFAAAENFCRRRLNARLVDLRSERKTAETSRLALGEDSVARVSYWWVGSGSTMPGEVRLVGGEDASKGNVLVGGRPVCDDSWDDRDASVVCRQLGYVNGTATTVSAFGKVSSDFAMDSVECRGDEDFLQLCSHSKNHDCGSNEGAGARCFGTQTREQLDRRRRKRVCQRATFSEIYNRYDPPLVQANCNFTHWFICESEGVKEVSTTTLGQPP